MQAPVPSLVRVCLFCRISLQLGGTPYLLAALLATIGMLISVGGLPTELGLLMLLLSSLSFGLGTLLDCGAGTINLMPAWGQDVVGTAVSKTHSTQPVSVRVRQ